MRSSPACSLHSLRRDGAEEARATVVGVVDQLGNLQTAKERSHTYILSACKRKKNENCSGISGNFSYEESMLKNSHVPSASREEVWEVREFYLKVIQENERKL